MRIQRAVLATLVLIQTVVSDSPAAESQLQVAKGVEIRVLSVQRRKTTYAFRGTYYADAPQGFEFFVVQVAVRPRTKPAGPIDCTTMAVRDTSGIRYPLDTRLCDPACDGSNEGTITCSFPFVVPRKTAISAFHVEGLVFALGGAGGPPHGAAAPARTPLSAARATPGASANASRTPATEPDKIADLCPHDVRGGEASAAYRARFASLTEVKSAEAYLALVRPEYWARKFAFLSTASEEQREQFFAQVRQAVAEIRVAIASETVEGNRATLAVCLADTRGSGNSRTGTVVMVRENTVWRVEEEEF